MQNKNKKFDIDVIILIALGGCLILIIIYIVFTGKQPLPLKTTKTIIDQEVNVYCDKETQVEYLIFTGDDRGGITVRYDNNGKIKRCDGNLLNSNKKIRRTR